MKFYYLLLFLLSKHSFCLSTPPLTTYLIKPESTNSNVYESDEENRHKIVKNKVDFSNCVGDKVNFFSI